MSKKTAQLTVRMSDDEKRALRAAASERGMGVADFLRSFAAGMAPQPTAPLVGQPSTPPLTVYHVDDLGDDALRTETGALVR